jgi:DNA modification methylase
MTAQPSMQKNVLNRQSELLLVFDKHNAISRQFEKCNFERGTMSDVWNIKRGKKINNTHGATFPEELVEKIILNFSNKKDKIYDPFSGTGTTLYVASKNDRLYIGSEISKEYCEISEKRLLNYL